MKPERQNGYEAGLRAVRELGIDAAKREAKAMSDNQQPTMQEYLYIDGFMNAVAEQL